MGERRIGGRGFEQNRRCAQTVFEFRYSYPERGNNLYRQTLFFDLLTIFFSPGVNQIDNLPAFFRVLDQLK